jgi:hypothetical protein
MMMKNKNLMIDEYMSVLTSDRFTAIQKLRTISQETLIGFEECMAYGMITYVVPFAQYPNGYHCDPSMRLPFISFASQKNFIAVYHMGIYANPQLLDWFVNEYPKHCAIKLDMGKSCIRFKKVDAIPFDLIKNLFLKMTMNDWIQCYENAFLKKK